MIIFVTGARGQLGYDVVKNAVGRGHIVIGSDIVTKNEVNNCESIEENYSYVQLNITNKDAVNAVMQHYKPDAIIHCAAWTAVDAAEKIENKEMVKKINVDGTKYIAEVAKEINSKLLYISTDYVFDGKGDRPWKPDDKYFAPLNYYGQTKYEGEIHVSSLVDKFFIVRIAWVFGLNGNNFIKTMINIGNTHDELRVVDDQIGTPTYTFDLSRLLVDMVETDRYGYYHATNEGGYISWADLAEESYRVLGMDVKVNRVTTKEYGQSIAARPKNSRLDKSKLSEKGFTPLPDWKDAVERYIKEAGFKNGKV